VALSRFLAGIESPDGSDNTLTGAKNASHGVGRTSGLPPTRKPEGPDFAAYAKGTEPGSEASKSVEDVLVKRPRVVLADDNKAILECVRELLISDFDVVATVQDGRQAFDAVMALRPEAVVLDISMPCSSGLDVAKRLSALPDPPRIVFLTVHEGADFLAAAREAGASGYVVKRNAGRDLIHALKQTLCGRRAFPALNYEGSLASD
jgi:CheY-like chemotaxis protein